MKYSFIIFPIMVRGFLCIRLDLNWLKSPKLRFIDYLFDIFCSICIKSFQPHKFYKNKLSEDLIINKTEWTTLERAHLFKVSWISEKYMLFMGGRWLCYKLRREHFFKHLTKSDFNEKSLPFSIKYLFSTLK